MDDGTDLLSLFDREIMDDEVFQEDWFIDEDVFDRIREFEYRLYERECNDLYEVEEYA